jgi:anhydro-N-acetylmuramic acid kinase
MRRSSDKKIFIGTMSGTSHDGIDICSLKVTNQISLLKFSSFKYPIQLREDVSRAIQHQELSLDMYFDLNRRIGHAFSRSIDKFLTQNKINKKNVAAIGLSGQTLFHQPKGKYPFSIQAGDPKIIANECGIDVVSDFRNDHIKLGGEGAPLVPEFHQKLFAKKNTPLAVLNIGGISNFTYLDGKRNFYGSDCGPGNALMDIYCQSFLNRPFDRHGEHANKGVIHIPSLNQMLSHSFFRKRHPKSTGKEIFNIGFIPKQLLKKSTHDILATLTELTAVCIAKSLLSLKKSPYQLIVCGGGIRNKFLVHSIEKHIKLNIISTSEYGFNPQAIEAMAFGWMARQRVYRNPLIVKNNKGLLGTLTKSK